MIVRRNSRGKMRMVSRARFQRLKVQAMNGDNSAIMQLGILTAKDHSLLPMLLPIVFRHTAETADQIMHCHHPLPPSIGPHAFASMDVLGRALLYPSSRPPESTKIRYASLIEEHLRGIWIWIRHFIINVADVPPQFLDPEVQRLVHDDLENTCTRLLSGLMAHKSLCLALLDYSDFAPALTRLCVHVLDSRFCHHNSSKNNMMSAFAYLQDKTISLWRPKVAEKYEELADVALPEHLKPFMYAISSDQGFFLSSAGLGSLLTDLTLFKNCYQSSPNLTARFLKRGAARWMSQFAYRLSCYSRYYETPDRGMTIQQRTTFITVLYFSLEFINHAVKLFGYTIVLLLLENRIFSVVINCIQHVVQLPRNPIPKEVASLLDSISKYSIYLPVLKSLLRHPLKKYLTRECLAQCDWNEQKELLRAIRDLTSTVEVRSRQRREYESRCISNPCVNKLCSRRDSLDVETFRCAGCKHALYCSRACQKTDWRNGHRESCLKDIELRASDDNLCTIFDTGQLDKLQLGFFDFVLEAELNNNRLELAQYSKTNGGSFPIVKFDFRKSVKPKVTMLENKIEKQEPNCGVIRACALLPVGEQCQNFSRFISIRIGTVQEDEPT
ncbi:hypothetical protein K435DRAFT_838694 [Dendrothele bispora CBS 962.96]|uniref:MYND-type domain-containing protein n=1 Tax=Dendrothele bispora (strain CBS 962.96) TaxID=1314807 RepID=A0A4S8M6E0_DENBC|nr:hypothetical protein K435DRAFT_838694 [Dendrothele bispora CBS 962.96]